MGLGRTALTTLAIASNVVAVGVEVGIAYAGYKLYKQIEEDISDREEDAQILLSDHTDLVPMVVEPKKSVRQKAGKARRIIKEILS